MTDIEGYVAGTPTWVDLMSADREASMAFYGPLLGWDFEVSGPEFGYYTTATVRGRTVAGIGELPDEQKGQPVAWVTYLQTDDIAGSAAAIAAAGGQVFVGPLQVADQGSMLLAVDTAGAVFGLWQPGRMRGAQVVNEPGALSWNELCSNDVDAARTFYSSLLGWTYEQVGDGETFDYTTVTVDGRAVAGIMPAGEGLPPGYPTGWNAYFAVDDVDKSVTQAQDGGGTVVTPPSDSPYGRLCALRDPAGAVFSLITLPPRPPG